MRLFIQLQFFLFLVLGFYSQASTQPGFDKEAFMRQGLSFVEQSLNDKLKDELPTNAACPASGSEAIVDLSSSSGKVMGALETVHNLMEQVKPAVHSKRIESNRCGDCKQTNVVSYYASINPKKFVEDAQCQGRSGETFAMDLQNHDEIKDFTEQILSGKNNEGKRLQQACPDPCSYYVTTAETTLPNGKTHLTLTVQCGQPRDGSIFSADYEFRAGLIHQWSCSK